MEAKAKLMEVIEHGGLWCETCERLTELVEDGRGGNVCVHCRSPRVRLIPPALPVKCVNHMDADNCANRTVHGSGYTRGTAK